MNRYEKWQLILLALYAEALRCGSFCEVTAKTMEMDGGVFGWTLYKLQMKGMIEGCRFIPPAPGRPGRTMEALRDGLLLTAEGFRAAEKMLGEGGAEAGQLRAAWEILRDAGCGIMAGIAYEWIC